MFRKVSTVTLVALAALTTCGAGVSPACAAETAAPQKPKEAGGNKQIAVDLGGGVKLTLTLIPAGEFKMGSGESAEATAAFFNKTYGEDFLTADFFEDEHPQHRVQITKPFYLGTYHVTRGQFRQFVTDTGYKTDVEKGENPGPTAGTLIRRSLTSTRSIRGETRVSSRPTSTRW
ncbi:MAG: SUMF1/EgtB/PvdO family nonheme iron enzyme [Planctomycetota bacterium]